MSKGWDVLTEEAAERLEAWAPTARVLFKELLEDAASDLQRELLQRAVASGHSSAEVHAFADELRGLADEEAFDACTLDADAPEGYTVVQMLRAEADPLYAFEVKGGALSPADDDSGVGPAPSQTQELEELDSLPYVPPPGAPRAAKKFDSAPRRLPAKKPDAMVAGSALLYKRVDLADLGKSGQVAPAKPVSGPVAAVPGPSNRLMEDFVNEATRPLGVSYREQDVDDGHLTLEAALGTAAGAVGRGIPVPAAIGPSLGKHQKLVLLLQTAVNSGKRAWQLYDPLSGELLWTSEADLLGRSELPFSSKFNRRITRIVLPVLKGNVL